MNQNHIWHKKYKMNKIDKFYAFQHLSHHFSKPKIPVPSLLLDKTGSSAILTLESNFLQVPSLKLIKLMRTFTPWLLFSGTKDFGRIEKFPPQKNSFKKCQNSDFNFKFSFSFRIFRWKMSFKESDFEKFNHFNVKSIGGEVGVVHVEINRPKVFNSMSEE